MIFIRKREPHKEFTPSKAYTYNFAAMRTIDDSVWGEAMNDPSWIRFITARHPLARKDDEFFNFEKSYKRCHFFLLQTCK